MKKTVALEQAVGMVLPHDITEIIPGRFKGRAFKKGHIIRAEDIEHLKRLGKEHIYVLSLDPAQIHENEAARMLATAIAGPGVKTGPEPVEGKIGITAAFDGLLKVKKEALYNLNMLGEVMCATLHDNGPVKKGEQVAATRLIPLVADRSLVEQAVKIATEAGGITSVIPLKKMKAGLVVTGNEVFNGTIEDAFAPVLRRKLHDLGSELAVVEFAPDDQEVIAGKIQKCLKMGVELVITSGGMSVDPDDVTREAIAQSGAENIVYGTPVLPGAMFLVGYLGEIPIIGLPACGMFHKITIFDLILPRVLAGEQLSRQDIAALGHGGLCRNCKQCRYPVCGFGK